jgi:putative transposase
MGEIADSFEAYGYRRMQAALRHRGLIVNHKKIRRLMRQHDLQPRRRRRYVATTDSAHEMPIFPNLTKDMTPTGPNQLWVADITYVAITASFVYVAVILDAWSRLVVVYAIGRSIDVRLTLAALRSVPPSNCADLRPAACTTATADRLRDGLNGLNAGEARAPRPADQANSRAPITIAAPMTVVGRKGSANRIRP